MTNREELKRRLRPDGPPGPQSLESRLHRLRRAAAGIGRRERGGAPAVATT